MYYLLQKRTNVNTAKNNFFQLVALFLLSILLCNSVVFAQQSKQSRDRQLRGKEKRIMQEIRNAQALEDTRASDAIPEVEREEIQQENIFLVLLRIAGILVLIIALLFGGSWVLKKFKLTAGSRGTSGAMEVIDSIPLGQNRALTMVRVDDTVYVLGNTASGITCIDTYQGDKALELISSTRGGVSMMKFKDALDNFLGKKESQA